MTGTDLDGATAVYFGSTPTTKLAVNKTGTSVTVVDPAGDLGQVPVVVDTPDGNSPLTAASHFTYE